MIADIQMTYTEKVAMYEKMKKGELIIMLIEANRHVERMTATLNKAQDITSTPNS